MLCALTKLYICNSLQCNADIQSSFHLYLCCFLSFFLNLFWNPTFIFCFDVVFPFIFVLAVGRTVRIIWDYKSKAASAGKFLHQFHQRLEVSTKLKHGLTSRHRKLLKKTSNRIMKSPMLSRSQTLNKCNKYMSQVAPWSLLTSTVSKSMQWA